jgi:hypothetical protein
MYMLGRLDFSSHPNSVTCIFFFPYYISIFDSDAKREKTAEDLLGNLGLGNLDVDSYYIARQEF